MTQTSASDTVVVRPMTIADHADLIDLMTQTPGVSVRDADSKASTERYLQRNPGLSFVAEQGGALVGCVMSGHDGRRGYLQHLVVRAEHRNRGVGGTLVEHCLAALEREGILKTHIDVLRTNLSGQRYWAQRGWTLRTDIHRYSFVRSGGENV